MSTPDELRAKALRYRERGNERMALIFERQASDMERIAEINAREERVRIRVKGKSYRVSMNYNGQGEWYANAHGRSDVMPAASVSGHDSRDACLSALREKLSS